MLDEVAKMKIAAYEHMRNASRYDARMLEISGFRGKTNADAVLSILQSTEKRIDKLYKEHLKKYPDR